MRSSGVAQAARCRPVGHVPPRAGLLPGWWRSRCCGRRNTTKHHRYDEVVYLKNPRELCQRITTTQRVGLVKLHQKLCKVPVLAL